MTGLLPSVTRPTGTVSRTLIAAIVVGSVLLAGAVVVQPAAADGTNNTTAPPDPSSDVLGWENGYWHNESVAVTSADGLNDSELEAVVARGMARVEYVRELEFDETPPVEVISRETYAQSLADDFSTLSQTDRLVENIKWEATFMVGENQNAVDVVRGNQAAGIGGFYDPAAGEIKIISENTSSPKMNEITLSQELFHYLQDETYNISAFDQSTEELHNAKDGIIEGDGNYVDRLYQQECTDGVWEGSCLIPQSDDAASGATPDLHFGLYQQTLQPYNTGPAWVDDRYESGGWEAVNEVYENPPASTEQVIHPEKYPQDEPTGVTVEDTSQEPWQQLERDGQVVSEQFGEAGLYVSLWYPSFQDDVQGEIIPVRDHFNLTDSGQPSTFETYLYEHQLTTGWEGEQLVPYVMNNSAETGETGYVYKLAWESADDASEFSDAWLELMEIHGAQPVDGHKETYRIPDENEFGDAFYLTQDGKNVTIVNAPTVDDLALVYDGAAPTVETPTATATPTSTAVPDETETTTDTPTPEPTTSEDGDGAGFTLVAGLLAVALVVTAAANRRLR